VYGGLAWAVPEPLPFGFRVRRSRGQIDLEGDRPLREMGRDIEPVRAVHVGGASQLDLVLAVPQPYGGDGVDALEDKIDSLTGAGLL
jgi:hypothetical protein